MTRLRRALVDYLKTRRALGFKLTREGRWLPDFVTYLEAQRCSVVTTAMALTWAAAAASARPRLGSVRGFAKYLQTIEPRTEVPSLDLLPRERPRSAPHVYSAEDLTALLAATDVLRAPFRATTYKTLLGLLAVTGMRVGEAIALDEADVDRRRAVLVIRKTKFGKSREVPLHTSTLQTLERYRRERDRIVPRRRSPSFFVSAAGTRLFYQNVHELFLRLVYAAGLGSRRPRPTIHDLRHTFAIRTVLSWYRDELDVEARLPLLSTYLGHIGPSSTYWYLTAVPELLAAATHRLERARVKL